MPGSGDDFYDPYGDDGGFSDGSVDGGSSPVHSRMRSDGRFLSEEEALTALDDDTFRSHLCSYCECDAMALPSRTAVESGSTTTCGVEYIAYEECYAVWLSAEPERNDAGARIHYLPGVTWCEQDLFGDGDSDADGAGGAFAEPHFVEAGLGFAGTSVVSAANARLLVQKDVDELNAISGVRAGFHFSEHASEPFPCKIWIGVDFEVRYGLTDVRADAWMTDPSFWLVQRLDFGAAYTRDVRGPQVPAALCGASDATDFNRVRLTVDPAGDAAAPLQTGDLKPFGVQWLFHNAAKKIFVGETSWPPPDLELRPWEILQAQRDAINPAFRPIAETLSVSGELAEALYLCIKQRLGRDPELTEVFDVWAAECDSAGMLALVAGAEARTLREREALARETEAMASDAGSAAAAAWTKQLLAAVPPARPSASSIATMAVPLLPLPLQRSSSSGSPPRSTVPRSTAGGTAPKSPGLRPPLLRRTLSSGSGGGGVSDASSRRFMPPALKRMTSSAQHLSNLQELQSEYAETLSIDLADAKEVLAQLRDGAFGVAGADTKVSMSAVLGSLYKHQARLPRPPAGSAAAMEDLTAGLDSTTIKASSTLNAAGSTTYVAANALGGARTEQWCSKNDSNAKTLTFTLAPDAAHPVDFSLIYLDVAGFSPSDNTLRVLVRESSRDEWTQIIAVDDLHCNSGHDGHLIVELAGDSIGLPFQEAPFHHDENATSYRIRQLQVKVDTGGSFFSIWEARIMAEPSFVASKDPIAAAVAELTGVAAIRGEEERDSVLDKLCARWRLTNHANVARVESAKLRPFIYTHAVVKRRGGVGARRPPSRQSSGVSDASGGGAAATKAGPPPAIMRQHSSGAFGRRATQRAFERAHAIEVAMCEKNVLIRVLHAIDFAIDRANTHCIITGKKHKYETVYPSACDDEDAPEYALAQLAYTDLGVGLELGTQFLHQPELVTLLISFLHAAANGGRVHLLYPSKVQAVGSDDRFDELTESESTGQTFPRLQACLAKIPPFAVMKKWAKAGTGTNGENVLLHQLNLIDPLLLPLLRWMVATNNGFVRLLRPDQRLPLATPYQFAMLTGSVEREMRFDQVRTDTVKARWILKTMKDEAPAMLGKMWDAVKGAKKRGAREGKTWEGGNARTPDATTGKCGFAGNDPLHEPLAHLRMCIAALAMAREQLDSEDAEAFADLERAESLGAGRGLSAGEDDDDEAEEFRKHWSRAYDLLRDGGAREVLATTVFEEMHASANIWGEPGWGWEQVGPPGKSGMQYWDDGPKPEKPGYSAPGSNGGVTSFDPLKHGSVFGWHGSQLGNWHVIMRTGLKNLSLSSYVRGTAHGPGIYFGYDHSTSAGYTDQGSNMWPETDYGRGKLGAHQTMCLVEVVARPEEFTKVSPYLVVPQEEFIQERYFTVFDNSRGESTPNVDMGTLHRKCTRLMEERRSAQLGDSLAGTVFT